jgi:Flp pilus assembly protein TadG
MMSFKHQDAATHYEATMRAQYCNSNIVSARRRRARRRKGATMILALVLMTALISVLALSIDIGFIATSKSEARRTADAAALAGCWQLFDSSALSSNASVINSQAMQTANTIAGLNPVCNASPSLSLDPQTADVKIGYMSSLSPNASIEQNTSLPYRAVQVSLRKTESHNGQVPLFFAKIFGQSGRNMVVESTAAMATQIKGFSLPSSGSSNLDVLPFAIDQTTWNNMLAGGGTDTYQFNASNANVINGSDGIREVNLYPQGTGSPGNRGTVDIGGSNNSTADIARQIVHGISAEDLTELGKPLVLGDTGTMTLNGDTGISAGVKDELASIIGQTRIIPVFSSVAGNGNNANYTIVRWVGVRILAVKLTGPMSGKHVMVQPAPIQARYTIAGDGTRTWSESIFSPVVLIK